MSVLEMLHEKLPTDTWWSWEKQYAALKERWYGEEGEEVPDACMVGDFLSMYGAGEETVYVRQEGDRVEIRPGGGCQMKWSALCEMLAHFHSLDPDPTTEGGVHAQSGAWVISIYTSLEEMAQVIKETYP